MGTRHRVVNGVDNDRARIQVGKGGRRGPSVTSVPPSHGCQESLSFGALENRVRSLLSMRDQEAITSNQLLAWYVSRVWFRAQA